MSISLIIEVFTQYRTSLAQHICAKAIPCLFSYILERNSFTYLRNMLLHFSLIGIYTTGLWLDLEIEFQHFLSFLYCRATTKSVVKFFALIC